MPKEPRHVYTTILTEHLWRQACGRIRALGVSGAGYCKAVGMPLGGGEFVGYVVRVPEGQLGRMGRFNGDDFFIPETSRPATSSTSWSRGGICLYRDMAGKARSAWMAIEEVVEDEFWLVVRTLYAGRNNSRPEPKIFRSRLSAINHVRETLIPEAIKRESIRDGSYEVGELLEWGGPGVALTLVARDDRFRGTGRLKIGWEVSKATVEDVA